MRRRGSNTLPRATPGADTGELRPARLSQKDDAAPRGCRRSRESPARPGGPEIQRGTLNLQNWGIPLISSSAAGRGVPLAPQNWGGGGRGRADRVGAPIGHGGNTKSERAGAITVRRQTAVRDPPGGMTETEMELLKEEMQTSGPCSSFQHSSFDIQNPSRNLDDLPLQALRREGTLSLVPPGQLGGRATRAE